MQIPNRPFSRSWRDMAHVPRWAILRKNRQQNLAEHSYFVTVYTDQIARLIGWDGDYGELMRYALSHDLDETITGDIPGPAKRIAWDKERAAEAIEPLMTHKYGLDVVDALSSVRRDIKAIVSVADSIDEVCYLTEEILSGNVWVKPVRVEAFRRLKVRWQDLPADPDLLDELWATHMYDICMHQEMFPVLLEDMI